MRVAPIAIRYRANPERALFYAARSSMTTHSAKECVDACTVFVAMLIAALRGCDRETVLAAADGVAVTPRIRTIVERRTYLGVEMQKDARGSDRTISSSGYVVDTLEAALWAFANTRSYKSAVLAAVNLGGDADTIGAVCGQLAGAHYGHEGIPRDWRAMVKCHDLIVSYADALHREGETN